MTTDERTKDMLYYVIEEQGWPSVATLVHGPFETNAEANKRVAALVKEHRKAVKPIPAATERNGNGRGTTIKVADKAWFSTPARDKNKVARRYVVAKAASAQ